MLGQLQSRHYSGAVQTKTIQIDGRKLVPIPDGLLEQCPLGDNVDVALVPGGLLVTPSGGKARAGWAKALEGVPQEQLDRDSAELRTMRELPTDFENREWDW